MSLVHTCSSDNRDGLMHSLLSRYVSRVTKPTRVGLYQRCSLYDVSLALYDAGECYIKLHPTREFGGCDVSNTYKKASNTASSTPPRHSPWETFTSPESSVTVAFVMMLRRIIQTMYV